MPYQVAHPAPETETITLWPHRSMPRPWLAVVILGMFLFITIPLFGLLGTVLLWGMLPFVLGAVAALWWGLERNYRDAELTEILTLSPELARLERHNPDGAVQEWECNAFWTRVEMHPSGGPVPHYVTLKGAGREVEIGAFLSEDERKALYDDLVTRVGRIGERPA